MLLAVSDPLAISSRTGRQRRPPAGHPQRLDPRTEAVSCLRVRAVASPDGVTLLRRTRRPRSCLDRVAPLSAPLLHPGEQGERDGVDAPDAPNLEDAVATACRKPANESANAEVRRGLRLTPPSERLERSRWQAERAPEPLAQLVRWGRDATGITDVCSLNRATVRCACCRVQIEGPASSSSAAADHAMRAPGESSGGRGGDGCARARALRCE